MYFTDEETPLGLPNPTTRRFINSKHVYNLKGKKMGRKQIGETKAKGKCFSMPSEIDTKLKDIAFKEGLSPSQMVCKLVSEYNPITFDVEKERLEIDAQIESEKRLFDERLKELNTKREDLTKIGKQKKVLDKAMLSKKDDYISRIVGVLDRKGSYEAIEAIAKEGQRMTGVDARQLISEAIAK